LKERGEAMMLKRHTTARSSVIVTALLLVTATGPASAAEWKIPDNAPLLTRWANDVGPDNALPEYPRPQMRRKEWMNLNELWDYAITGKAGFELWPNLRENKVNFYKNTGSWFTADLVLAIKDARLWSPDDPFLYDLTVTLKKDGKALDTVNSYFGMRSLGKQTNPKGFTRFLLNGKPTLMAGALDQGFWPDGIHTAATDEALKYDVEIAKKAGFNIIRKHVKVEPERFYYWCDKLGLMVLQDMPTGREGDARTDLPISSEASAQCELEKCTLTRQRWNHPSIIAWCPFNEGWG
jgi:hypothetical protein